MNIDSDKIRRFLHALIRNDGGYAEDSSLMSSQVTSSNSVAKVLEILGYPHGNPRKVQNFILSCYDADSGGFSQSPASDATPFYTASALIALKTLGAEGDVNQYLPGALQYLRDHSQTQYDHFMTVAVHEECAVISVEPQQAIDYFAAKVNEQGTYGASVRENAIAAASLIRAKQALPNPAAVAKLLLAGQGEDGGFVDRGDSDLMTTYCVVRALTLLRVSPDIGRLTHYLESLEAEIGYSSVARGAAAATPTYLVASIYDWLPVFQRSAVQMARAGDVAGISQWLSTGGDPDRYDTEGWTPLLAAAARGKVDIVDLLLSHDISSAKRANPDIRFLEADALPIYMAGQSGNLDTVKRLLTERPNHLHEVSKVNGHTVLLQAAFYGKSQHLKLVEYLLDNVCSILGVPDSELERAQKTLTTATNVRGYTALTMQDLWHNEPMKELLRKYPQPSDVEREVYLSKLLLSLADPQSLTERVLTRLSFWQKFAKDNPSAEEAVIDEALTDIVNLVDHDHFEINRLGSALYQTPLIFAITGVDQPDSLASKMRYALVELLLKKGADPVVRERHPMAIGAVIRASVLNQFSLLKLLFEYMQPDVFAVEMNVSPAVNGLTAMHDAVHRALTSPAGKLSSHIEQIEWMRQHGGRIDIPDHTGQTQRQLAIDARQDSTFDQANINAVSTALGIQ